MAEEPSVLKNRAAFFFEPRKLGPGRLIVEEGMCTTNSFKDPIGRIVRITEMNGNSNRRCTLNCDGCSFVGGNKA